MASSVPGSGRRSAAGGMGLMSSSSGSNRVGTGADRGGLGTALSARAGLSGFSAVTRTRRSVEWDEGWMGGWVDEGMGR